MIKTISNLLIASALVLSTALSSSAEQKTYTGQCNTSINGGEWSPSEVCYITRGKYNGPYAWLVTTQDGELFAFVYTGEKIAGKLVYKASAVADVNPIVLKGEPTYVFRYDTNKFNCFHSKEGTQLSAAYRFCMVNAR